MIKIKFKGIHMFCKPVNALSKEAFNEWTYFKDV